MRFNSLFSVFYVNFCNNLSCSLVCMQDGFKYTFKVRFHCVFFFFKASCDARISIWSQIAPATLNSLASSGFNFRRLIQSLQTIINSVRINFLSAFIDLICSQIFSLGGGGGKKSQADSISHNHSFIYASMGRVICNNVIVLKPRQTQNNQGTESRCNDYFDGT